MEAEAQPKGVGKSRRAREGPRRLPYVKHWRWEAYLERWHRTISTTQWGCFTMSVSIPLLKHFGNGRALCCATYQVSPSQDYLWYLDLLKTEEWGCPSACPFYGALLFHRLLYRSCQVETEAYPEPQSYEIAVHWIEVGGNASHSHG